MRIHINPMHEILIEAIAFLNEHISAGDFPFLKRNTLIESCDHLEWIARQLSGRDYRVVATDSNDQIIGVGYWTRGSGRQINCATIGFTVHPKMQGRGIGKRVCKVLIEGAEKYRIQRLSTTPYVTNRAAINVLKKCGFRIEGTLKRFASLDTGKCVDALQMAYLFKQSRISKMRAKCPLCFEEKYSEGEILIERELAFACVPSTIFAIGQCLVLPKRHCELFEELSPNEILECFELASEIVSSLKTSGDYTGANLLVKSGGSSGQSSKHMHIHIIPRIEGDLASPNLWFNEDFEDRHFEPSKDYGKQWIEKYLEQ